MATRGQKLAAAGGTALIAEPVLALAHQGAIGVIVGIALGAAAYAAADDVEKVVGKGLPSLPTTQKNPGKPSVAHRLFNGKSVRGNADEMIEPSQSAHRAPDTDASDDLTAPTFAPSGPLYFSQVLKTFTPTLNRIYLGTLANGEHIFIPAHELCHTALSGATRGGKDHLIRQLMSQLCKAGAKCYLLDPNYTRYDLEARDPQGRACPEDWTPFDAWLKNDPRELIPVARKYQVIEHYLKAAYELVNQRLEARGHAQKLGAPQFLFINEIPAIVDEVPNTAAYLKKILREGAKLGVFMVNASQDFQVGTVFKEVGGGVRQCYLTAFDVGSDPATQRALGLPVINEGLGKGKVSLRCKDILDTVYVPYVDNEALYQLLGPSTYTPESDVDWQAEDELVSYMVGGSSYEERETPPALPVTTPHYHSHATGRDAQVQRRAEREQRLRGACVAQACSQSHPLPPDEQLAYSTYADGMSWRDLAKQLDWGHDKAYRIRRQLIERGLVTEDGRKL